LLNSREFDAIFAEIAVIAGNSFEYHRYNVKWLPVELQSQSAMHTQFSARYHRAMTKMTMVIAQQRRQVGLLGSAPTELELLDLS
jgi:hypothetical protein